MEEIVGLRGGFVKMEAEQVGTYLTKIHVLTPVLLMEAGIADHIWSLEEIVRLID